MDTGKIKDASKKVAEVRDKAITKTMGMVDEKTKGKGTVAVCMALLVVGALAMDSKIAALVFGAIALADVIAALVPETKKEEPKTTVEVEVKAAAVSPEEKKE